jgi:hypothetical protein
LVLDLDGLRSGGSFHAPERSALFGTHCHGDILRFLPRMLERLS